MLTISSEPIDNNTVILFQRFTVMASELILYWALTRYIQNNTPTPTAANTTTSTTTLPEKKSYQYKLIATALYLHPGLWIVDHLHFQYNGLLYGILIHSIVEAQKNRLLWSGVLFAILLNFKHIYLYLAPAYFVYLLQAYCFILQGNQRNFSPGRFILLGSSVLLVFGISLSPFILTGQTNALLNRLFPFTRGLCHAYWAPNVWALYAGLDRFLILVSKVLGWSFNVDALGSMTRGYVGDTVFAVLPTVQPIHTLILTVLFQILTLQVLWRKPTFENFISSLTLCGFASYLFGWHVHEKAIMIVLIPYGFMAMKSIYCLRIFIILSSAGIVSLYPLLFHHQETPIKIFITLIWYLAILPGLCYCHNIKLRHLLIPMEKLYLMGLILVQCYNGVLHSMLFGTRYEFLPLMLTSLSCSVGILYGWILMMKDNLYSQ
ncbi:unnamed protein product [Cunninghamella echinulata]